MVALRTLAVAALCVGSTTAFAQGSNTQAGQQSAPMNMNVRQKISSDLEKDGYTGVNVLPSSFLVHATDKHGHPVAMVIGPDFVTEVTELPKGSTGRSSSSSGTEQNTQH